MFSFGHVEEKALLTISPIDYHISHFKGSRLLSFINIICIALARISFTSSNSHSGTVTGASNYSEKAIIGARPMTSILASAVTPQPEVKRMISYLTPSGMVTVPYPDDSVPPPPVKSTLPPEKLVPAPMKEPITSTPALGPVPAPMKARDWAFVPAKGPIGRPIVSEKKSRVKIVIIVTAAAVIAAVLLAIIFLSYKMIYIAEPKKEGTTTSLPSSAVNIEWKSIVQQEQVHSSLSSNLQMGSITADAESGRIVEMHGGLSSNQQHFLEPTEVYTNLSLDDILYIKSYCRESRPTGEGSFARVYKMIFQGEVLAMKEIEHRTPHTKRWVENEVDLLLGKEHINVNKLYAWCIEENVSYLAYMYIDGCSLDDYLRGNCVGFTYSWKQSFSMIMGIAKGIEFLHSNKIIHVDIKPQNIMVDGNDNEAKIVDFGLSKHVDWEGTHRSTAMVVGTRGYWAPEYCWNNKISYKHDVYSFGIVVLEMITGQRHVDQARGSSQFHIPGYVRYMIEKNRFEEAVDAKLKQDGWDNFCLEEALGVANIALRCAHPDKAGRPDMNVVVTELTSMMTSANNNITRRQRVEEIIPLEDVTS